MTDIDYMQLALELAQKGCGHVNPNPMVGAVIVKDGHIIGRGYHQKYGELHAERNALAACTESTEGAVIYVTMEPCCHFGKTPPCTEAIIESGIKRVVIGSYDPNPITAKRGVAILRQKGIEVTEGVMQAECDQLNHIFFWFMKHRAPYVVMKYAMTMDGKIATSSGKSKWITGDIARQRVQQDRNRYTAIMAGVGTILADDPRLTCRMENGKNPIRLICDTRLRTPLEAKVVTGTLEARTIIITCCKDTARHEPYLAAGCEVLLVEEKEGHVDLNASMKKLGEMDIDSVYLEGGEQLNWSAIESGIVHKVDAYIAPQIFGGSDAKVPVGGLGVESPKEAYKLSQPRVTQLGDDFLLESEVVSCSQAL